MRYLMTFSYDGNCFKGYQRQPFLKTVQGVLEKELSLLNDSKVELQSSGRTDVGVHAINQKAHFDFNKDILPNKIKDILNNKLNNEIYIKDIEEVDNEFHARYNCITKEYRYYLNMGEINIFKRNYIYQYNKKLNVKKMNQAIRKLIGTYDFRSFCTDSFERENCIRTIYKASIRKKGQILEFSFVGNGFLKYMIRNIVGLLIEIGSLKREVNDITKILEMKEKKYNIKTAPSCGLYLYNVSYK